MTRYEYKLFMSKRQRMIDLKSKGKFVLIPKKVKPVKKFTKWDLIEV